MAMLLTQYNSNLLEVSGIRVSKSQFTRQLDIHKPPVRLDGIGGNTVNTKQEAENFR
jgi:hypothetical protein